MASLSDSLSLKSAISLPKMSKYARPPIPPISSLTDSITFQCFDVNQYVKKVPSPNSSMAMKSVPSIRLYGVTRNGNSVCANVNGFNPYFFLQIPNNIQDPESYIPIFRQALEEWLKGMVKHLVCPEYVLQVEIVQGRSLYHYSKDHSDFYKVTIALPEHMSTARRAFSDMNGDGPNQLNGFQLFEADLDPTLRFMIDRDLSGASWIQVPSGKYTLHTAYSKQTTCQIEFDVHYTHLITHNETQANPNDEQDWSALAPFRVCSYDIECLGRLNHFPTPEHDPVIQIASIIHEFGSSEYLHTTIFCLGTCDPIAGADVHAYATEKEMLIGWKRFILSSDPDFMTGYNISKFDIWYLIQRANILKIDEFKQLSRLKNHSCEIINRTFKSKAYGTVKSRSAPIQGRVEYDVMTDIKRSYKLRSYTLNNVSAEFLGEQKEDVHYSIIGKLQRGTSNDRRRLAVYCIKDALLPLELINHLMILVNAIEMARVTGVPIGWLLSRGQQIKVMSQLYRAAKARNFLIPTRIHQNHPDSFSSIDGDDDSSSTAVGYEGATVIPPKVGFYKEKAITTLDFSSLYPSIMMAHNLCYSTLLPPNFTPEHLDPVKDITQTEAGARFVKPHICPGLLPEILDQLLSARKVAKKALKACKDKKRKQVLNGRQLALKVSANSVYGFTGSSMGKLKCLEISATVTWFGRQMILETQKRIQDTYPEATVIYGDTDSVMVDFGPKHSEIDKAIEIGIEAGKMVTSHFKKPINLEFEKVYKPYLLLSKKRYAGLYWTNPKSFDKLDCKGIEVVRRDNCRLAKHLFSTCLNKILIENDIPGSIQFVKDTIRKLLMNKVDISLLVISKSLSKEKYDAKLPHTELAARLKKRDPGTAPQIGDRVPYVIIQGLKGQNAYEKSEDPLYALENSMNIDTHYYLNNQLKKPLTRLYTHIIGKRNTENLFTGAHTRSTSKIRAAAAGGGLFSYNFQEGKSCLGCKTLLTPEDHQGLCRACLPRELEVYHKQILKFQSLEHEFSTFWTTCQRCQGSTHQDVLCSNQDCPIFFRRTKARKLLEEQQKTLDRFHHMEISYDE